MKTYARLHLYPHHEPHGRAYIVADPAALKALSEVCKIAYQSMTGIETAKYFGSDGHEYELTVVSDISEEEWQQLPLPGINQQAARQLSIVKTFDELVGQLPKKEIKMSQ